MLKTTIITMHSFYGLFSWYQKGKTRLGLNEARDDVVVGCSGVSWTICKQSAPCCRQITTPTPHYSILQAACPSRRPTNSINALKTQSKPKTSRYSNGSDKTHRRRTTRSIVFASRHQRVFLPSNAWFYGHAQVFNKTASGSAQPFCRTRSYAQLPPNPARRSAFLGPDTLT